MAKIHPLGDCFPPKNYVLLSNFFSSSNMFFIRLFLANTWEKIRGSPCSFKRKREFISISSLVWRKSLTFCACTRPCERANDAEIVRSNAQCNTKELLQIMTTTFTVSETACSRSFQSPKTSCFLNLRWLAVNPLCETTDSWVITSYCKLEVLLAVLVELHQTSCRELR